MNIKTFWYSLPYTHRRWCRWGDEPLIVPTKFITGDEDGRWSSSPRWEPNLMSIFLKHLWLIPNILKWRDCKIFTKLVPSQTPSRKSNQRCSVKEGVLRNLRNFTGKDLCWSLFLIKFWGLFQRRCFPVKLAKFLATTVLKNICELLLLSFVRFNVGSYMEIRRDKRRWETSDKSVNGNVSLSLCSCLFLSLLNSHKKYQLFFIFVSRR